MILQRLHYKLVNMSLLSHRRDQLLQSDDPSFHPALIGMDSLPSLELYLNDPSSQIESLFSPRSSNSNRSTAQQLPELDIPSSSVEGGVGFDVAGAFGDSGSGGGSGGVKRSVIAQYHAA